MLVDKVTHLKIIKDQAIKMVKNGLIDEVEELMNKNFSPRIEAIYIYWLQRDDQLSLLNETPAKMI